MLTEEKKEEPIVEETPPSESPKTETIAFLRPTNEHGAFVMESITKDTDDEDVEDEERCFDEEDVDRETGEILWGSYARVISGLTVDDRIAFPYDKNAKDGVKAKEAELSELYSY